MTASPGVPRGDIRWKFDLAGEFSFFISPGCAGQVVDEV
jgi:hypothetical protein